MAADPREHSEISPSSLNCMRLCPCFRGGLSSDVAETGERIHEYFADLIKGEPLPKDADLDEVEQAEWAVSTLNNFMSQTDMHVEEQLYLIDDDTFEEIMWGYADVFSMTSRASGDIMVLADLKTGEPRDCTAQMAAYARMLYQKYDCGRVEVHVLYSRYKKDDTYILNFGDTDFIFDVIKEAQKEGRQPVFCEYCGWCSLQSACPQTKAIITAITKSENYDITDIVDWKIENASPDKLGQMYLALSWLESFADRVKSQIKQKVQDGMEIPGFKRVTTTKRSIKDLPAAFTVSGLSSEDFLDCCSVSVSKLQKKLGRDTMDSILGDLITTAEVVQLRRAGE